MITINDPTKYLSNLKAELGNLVQKIEPELVELATSKKEWKQALEKRSQLMRNSIFTTNDPQLIKDQLRADYDYDLAYLNYQNQIKICQLGILSMTAIVICALEAYIDTPNDATVREDLKAIIMQSANTLKGKNTQLINSESSTKLLPYYFKLRASRDIKDHLLSLTLMQLINQM